MSTDWVHATLHIQMPCDRPPHYTDLSPLTSIPIYKHQSDFIIAEESRSNQYRMDPHDPPEYDPEILVSRQRQDDACMPYGSHHSENARQQPATNPLAQGQWARVPTRPPDFGTFIATNPGSRGLNQPSLQRTQSVGPAFRPESSPPKSSGSRPRRRPRPLDQERLRQPLNPSMLYPQMSPYAVSDTGSDNDTFDYQPRSISQPTTPGLLPRVSEVQATTLPRHGTYPPASERSDQNESIINDAAFNDEHEFRLFVEATAGLGPIPSVDHRGLSSPFTSHSHPIHHNDSTGRFETDTSYMISPTADTPTTVQALQYLAQMPENTSQSPPQPHNIQAFGPDFDSWLQSPPSHVGPAQRPSMPQLSTQAVMPDWTSVPDVSPLDEELPDYAESQAQAQAVQRVEATRRAQELQRRWQESGRRTTRYS